MGLYADPCYRRLAEETFFKNLSSKTHTLQKPDLSYRSTVLPCKDKSIWIFLHKLFLGRNAKPIAKFYPAEMIVATAKIGEFVLNHILPGK